MRVFLRRNCNRLRCDVTANRMAGQEKRPRQRKELKRHVSLMRQVAQQVVDNRSPNDARPVPSPPWWSTVFSSRYKTEMCHHLDELGFCNFGAGCVYAHSAAELRPLPRHPKHRSQLCKDFHDQGFCSFGSRCSFIHTRRETADIVEDVLNNMRVAPPMPENPATVAAAGPRTTSGMQTPAKWAGSDKSDPTHSSTVDGGVVAPPPSSDGTPPPKRRKRRGPGKKNQNSDPHWNNSTWKREETDLPPVTLEPTLLDTPLEADFRRRWNWRWKEMPYRRLDVFEQLCPRTPCTLQ